MLHKCANPDCSSVFRRLSHGKLFLLEIDQAMESSHRPSPTTPPTNRNPDAAKRQHNTRAYIVFLQARQSSVTALATSLAAEDSQFGLRRLRNLRIGLRAERLPK